jgi:nucleoside-diphosphate-sugar epimerase
MRILITGSSGLIGRWVVAQLKTDGHVVAGLDVLTISGDFGKPDFFFNCDILDRNSLVQITRNFAPDALVHLAARVDLDEKVDLGAYASNVEGVANVIDAVRGAPSVQRAIYTSSQLVCRVGYVPTSDTDYCPSTVYGHSKVRTEQIVREAAGGTTSWCLVRPTTVWGPYMSPHYQKLLRLIKKRLFFHSGGGKLYKSYAYAGNIAHQYRQLLAAPPSAISGRTLFLCDYEPLSLRDYADSLAREMGAAKIPTLPIPLARAAAILGDGLNAIGMLSFPFNSFRLNNILTEYIFDVSETRKVCGPLPYDFQHGVRETARWFMQQEISDVNSH